MEQEIRVRRVRVAAAVAALAVATILRILYLRSLPGAGSFIKYTWFADEILAGRFHGERLADLSPGYLWFITMLRAVDLGPWTLRGIQVAMVSGVAFCAGTVARRFAGWPAAVVAALLVLANRAALINASDFEPETLLVFLEAIAVAIVLREAPATRRSTAVAGLMIGLAIVTRPVALLAGLVLAGVLFARSRRVTAVFALAAALPVLAILAVNAKLTGDAVIMDPGTVFYEGMNPRASGLTGELPLIVRDLQPAFDGPDTLHVAYRVIASRAEGRELSREESNGWWGARALSFVASDPAGAAALTLRKAHYALQSYDAWDVPSMAMLQRSMTAPLWIPWSVLFGLALAGLLLSTRDVALPLAMLAIATAAPMLLFFVTGRHRNPLLLPVAVAAALGLVFMWRAFRSGESTRAAIVTAIALAIATGLAAGTAASRADDYVVRSGLQLRTLGGALNEALRNGENGSALELHALARVIAPDSVPMVPRDALERAARRELSRVDDEQRLFRIAIALHDSGAVPEARTAFAAVHEGEPLPTRALPPPSLYLARSFAAAGDRANASKWLAIARRVAPLNSDVLALRAALERNAAASALLSDLYDPFTAALARNEADFLLCRDDRCRQAFDRELLEVGRALPMWKRPAQRVAERRAH